MEDQILCIDGMFTPDQLAFWAKYGVKHPIEDKIYSVREVIYRNSNGDSGFLLNEINNPTVPIEHPILGVTQIEPYWHIRRFAHLDQTPLSIEEVKEWDRQKVLFKNLNF